MENKHNIGDLYQMQSLSLESKIRMTEYRVRQWVDEYGEDGVYISLSGGKDSTVLMDIIRNKMRMNIPAVFVDVPTQYPELKQMALMYNNVEIIKPKLSYMEICEQYGFPLISKEIAHKMHDLQKAREHGIDSYAEKQFKGTYISKNGKTNGYSVKKYEYLLDAPFKLSHKCCDVLKKQPLHGYEHRTKRHGITAQMAEESLLRKQQWFRNGCNGFHLKRPVSNPMSFWSEQDVLEYIYKYNITICSVYGCVTCDGCKYDTEKAKRTGCMLCGFGCHMDKTPNRFQILKEFHPKMYDMLDVCKNNGYTMREAIEWLNEHGNMKIRLR